MYHFPAIWLFQRRWTGGLHPHLRDVGALAATIVLSALSNELFEKK